MASAWTEEDTFVCSVCLDTLKDPATLPCGHSYCLACIQSHWDKNDSKGEYSCPQCRQIFRPRPSLAKSTLLVEAMEKLKTNSLTYRLFTPAPSSVPIYLEVLPDTGPQQGTMYPELPTVDPRPCPKHNRPMDLFCHEDKVCVCEVCWQQEHEGHQVHKPQEERRERQRELVEMQVDVQRKLQESEKELKEIPHVAGQQKALVQALKQEDTDIFSELVRHVSLTGEQIGELLSTHETSLGSHAEGQIHRLQQEMAQLRWKSEELNRLADMQDDICFLKNFFTLEPLGHTDTSGQSVSQEEAVVASIRLAVKELQESIEEVCKASLTKIATIVNQDTVAPILINNSPPVASASAAATSGQSATQNTVYEMTSDPPPVTPRRLQEVKDSSKSLPTRPARHRASAPPLPSTPLPSSPPPSAPPLNRARPATTVGLVSPQPKTRAELLKFRFEPTMDPNTVYRHVQLSDGGRTATMQAGNLNLPDHPERFSFWRQVLCKEPLAGSPYYWEVEWTGQKITIGVASKDMERKGSDNRSRLGHNALSWTLYWSGTGFSFWHDGQEKLLGSPKARRIGVYLDQHAGILAYYRIANNQADLIHCHQGQLPGPLYPGFRFWSGVGVTVSICQLE
ncbi:finTRIM family, member 86 [Antennarius striatus]|uniref:finTRIM family, member 86 n=1 Tax=Antennarius striatus TaxID=241820 RepID=UPI0035B0BFDD